jgi:hypothetical protein
MMNKNLTDRKMDVNYFMGLFARLADLPNFSALLFSINSAY